MKYRWEIINAIIGRCGYKRYLEIGVKDGVCYNRVKCSHKFGIDIKPLIVNPNVKKMSSDDFFSATSSKFDIIFIDGDHHEEQVDRDIQNSLKHLKIAGTIVMHDCSPKAKEHAINEREPGQVLWSGTAYKSYLKLRRNEPKLGMFVVDLDWGCGVIQRGGQVLLDIPKDPTWDEFDERRAKWLNLISVEEFQRRFA